MKRTTCCLTAGLLLAMTLASQAQEAAPVETIPVQTLPEESAVPATETNATPVQLEAVVVKGEKLGRTLSETTTSVSVFNGKNIDDQGDGSLGELLRRAANTTANEEGNISIRGVSQSGAAGGTGSPLISVQVDGVTLDRTSQQGAGDELFDVDQVEVLRGAQSTSQGRNALAGAVVINTREPTREWELRTRAILAQRDGREHSAAGGGPLSESLAFRLVGSFQNDDGFITHEPDGYRDFARTQKALLRGKLAFAPEGSAFDSLLTVGADRANGQPDYNIESGEAGSDPAQRRTSTVNEQTGDLTRSGSASWRNRLRLGEYATLTALTAHMRTQQDYRRDFDGLAEDGGTNVIYSHGFNVSQELRLNLKDIGPFTGVVGVYGGRFRDDNVFYSNDVFVTVPQATGVPIPIAGDLVGVELDFVSQANKDARNLAGFTEFDIQLPWRLTATLGLRYDRETLRNSNLAATTRGDALVATPAGLAQVPLLGGVVDDVLALQPGINVLPALLLAPNLVPNTNGEQLGRTRYSALLPKAGLRWAVTSQWSVFATYAEAYRAGGVDVDTQTGESVPYKPEYTQNYEVGTRGDYGVFDLAANVFYTDWRDQQVPVLRGQFFVTQNAARSKLYGGETSIGWRPARTLRVQLAAGVVRTQFVDYQTPGADYSGNQFIFAPRVTSSLGAVWRPQRAVRGLMASANLSQRGMSFTSPANIRSERSESRVLLDGRIGYERSGWRVYLFGKNLTNEDVVTETYQFPNGYIGAPGARGYAAYSVPRTLGVQLEGRF
ncbi:MAG: TonB-dependent receptor [Stagnimonas sp.]|nr:TonB-dependent receptor [Stagnimonas sp.]